MARFRRDHLHILAEAQMIAEEAVHDYYALSTRSWLRLPYDVWTREQYFWPEHLEAFAQLLIYRLPQEAKNFPLDKDFLYLIVLNDQRILRATGGGLPGLLLPFLTYILTHELIHMVRFSRFEHLPEDEDFSEERSVHGLVKKVLAGVKIKNLDRVLARFDRLYCNIN
ncbi:hypothetical protein [Thermosulfuriphilus sp.]